MIYVAHIKDGLVTQVILTTNQSSDNQSTDNQYEEFEDNTVVVGEENTVGVGWTYKDGKFSPPLFIPEK